MSRQPLSARVTARPTRRLSSRAPRRGVTILIVLILMSVMVLGGMALARMTEVGTLAAGNSANREVSLQASEVGINTAYAAVQALADENTDTGNWYWATTRTIDSNGMPSVDWSSAPQVTVGSYTVSYVVDRVCNTAPVTDTLRQCLVRQVPQIESSRVGAEAVDPPNARQFRITVRVLGPKDIETYVQTLATRG